MVGHSQPPHINPDVAWYPRGMPRPPALQLDKTELVLFDAEAKRPQVHNIRCDEISRIQRGTRRRFRLFHFVEDDVLELHVGRRMEPLLISRSRNKTEFDGYERGLEEFARRNNLTFGRSLPG